MGLRVIHHEGDKDLLLEKVKVMADQLKNEYQDDFEEGWWERAVDSVVKKDGDFSRPGFAPLVLYYAINDIFPPVSDDHYASGYLDLADRTSGKLATTLRMFVEGRNFSTGNSEFGDENTCGYLTPDEVREFLGLLKAYTPSNEDDKYFVDDLIDIFSTLVEKNSGDLFIMG